MEVDYSKLIVLHSSKKPLWIVEAALYEFGRMKPAARFHSASVHSDGVKVVGDCNHRAPVHVIAAALSKTGLHCR